jgi:hypothetical protein
MYLVGTAEVEASETEDSQQRRIEFSTATTPQRTAMPRFGVRHSFNHINESSFFGI